MSNTSALELEKSPIILLHDNLEEARKLAAQLSEQAFVHVFSRMHDNFETLPAEEREELILALSTNVTLDDIAKADIVIALWSSGSELLWRSRDLLSAALVTGNLAFVSLDGSEPPLGFRQCATFSSPVANERLEHLIQLLQTARQRGHRQAEELEQSRPHSTPLLYRKSLFGGVAVSSFAVLLLFISSSTLDNPTHPRTRRLRYRSQSQAPGTPGRRSVSRGSDANSRCFATPPGPNIPG